MSAFGSGRATRHADQMYNLQKRGAMQQQDLYNQTLPMYQQALQFFQQRANPQMLGAGTSQQPQFGPATHAFQALSPQQAMQPQNGPNRNGGFFSRHAQAPGGGAGPYGQGPGGVSNQQMGIWNNPEDALRMAQAQEDINRQQTQGQHFLQHNLADRGLLDSGAYAGGLTRLADNANQQFSDFRRNQAIGAGQEAERRQGLLMNALAPGMGGSQAAMQAFQGLGQTATQQQQNAQQQLMGLFSSLGQLGGMFLPQPGQMKRF